MLLEQVVAATSAHPIMPHGDCICDAACVAKKARRKVLTACNADVRAILFKICLRVFWEVPVGSFLFKLETDPAEASKAIIEATHQRAVDTR